MPRILFEKKGNAVWISHLDLMRVFQRAFKRAQLPLTHSKGFNPRPSVSIALPRSVGIESHCELLDFELEGDPVPLEEIRDRLNAAMISGVRVLDVYSDMKKLKNLAYLECCLDFEYDNGIPEGALEAITNLLKQENVMVEKRSKNGVSEQNIVPMIRRFQLNQVDAHTLQLKALVCCQNPTLNPMQLSAAVERYLPAFNPDFVKCARIEIYDTNESGFR